MPTITVKVLTTPSRQQSDLRHLAEAGWVLGNSIPTGLGSMILVAASLDLGGLYGQAVASWHERTAEVVEQHGEYWLCEIMVVGTGFTGGDHRLQLKPRGFGLLPGAVQGRPAAPARLDLATYIPLALRTEGPIQHQPRPRMLHALLGLVTEVGELGDLVKRHSFYGKEPAPEAFVEELGDLFWYLAVLIDDLGLDPPEILEANVRKLRARYPDKFTADAALHRDTEREMEAVRKARRDVYPYKIDDLTDAERARLAEVVGSATPLYRQDSDASLINRGLLMVISDSGASRITPTALGIKMVPAAREAKAAVRYEPWAALPRAMGVLVAALQSEMAGRLPEDILAVFDAVENGYCRRCGHQIADGEICSCDREE